MELKENMGNTKSPRVRNINRTKWSLQLSNTNVLSTDPDNKLSVKLETVRFINTFDGGMVYKVRGTPFVLNEYVIDGYPFLVVLRPDEGEFNESLGKGVFEVPKVIKGQLQVASRHIVQNIKVPSNLQNTEIEVTEYLEKAINLQPGWSLTKAILKIPQLISDDDCVKCDDGPCESVCNGCERDCVTNNEPPSTCYIPTCHDLCDTPIEIIFDETIEIRLSNSKNNKNVSGRLVNLPKLGDSSM